MIDTKSQNAVLKPIKAPQQAYAGANQIGKPEGKDVRSSIKNEKRSERNR